MSKDKESAGLSKAFFPERITQESVFEPAKSSAGPSFELALNIKRELVSKGYSANAVNDLGHDTRISIKDIISNARQNGFDAAFIVYYSGLDKWTSYSTTTYTPYYAGDGRYRHSKSVIYDVHKGFLYLPNAALIDTKDNSMLWSTQHYGLVEYAKVFNISGQPFNKVVTEAILPYGDKSYLEAAGLAKDMIFKPEFWPRSFIEFPVLKKRNENRKL